MRKESTNQDNGWTHKSDQAESYVNVMFGWLVLVCSERRVLLADCWWLVCSERKVLLTGG
jgi:hypothetical protein